MAAGQWRRNGCVKDLALKCADISRNWAQNKIAFESWDAVHANPFFAPNAREIDALKPTWTGCAKSGESCGARINVVAAGVPVGQPNDLRPAPMPPLPTR